MPSEDGPYGSGMHKTTEKYCNDRGFKVVFSQLYAHDLKDMTPLILNMKASKPDAIFHCGYFGDVALLLKQGRQLGLKFKQFIGSGGGFSNIPLLSETIGEKIVNDLYLIGSSGTPFPDLIQPNMIPQNWRKWNAEFISSASKYNLKPSNVAFWQSWVWSMVLLNYVLPDAVQKFGFDPSADRETQVEALRKACRDLNIPEGGTGCLYGVRFAPESDDMAGQNMAVVPTLMQLIHGRWTLVWPNKFKTADPVIPIPKGSIFAVE